MIVEVKIADGLLIVSQVSRKQVANATFPGTVHSAKRKCER